MSEQTGKYSSTLHSALGLVTEEDSPLNDTEMLSADLIVVDEFSMVDMRLAYVLLERIKPGAQLIIVGDADQLPSVGAGNVLREMIRSEKVPTAVLETVFRQASNSRIITYDWDMYAVQGPDSVKAMNAMLDAPVDDLKRFGICERKLGGIPVYIHRSGFTGENGYEIYSAFDKSAEIHDLALKAVESVGGRELQTLEVYVRSIPMEKGFALKQDFKHLSPYECGLGWAVAADKDFIGKEAALARKEHPKYRMVGLEFSRESTEDISIWERVYWYGVEVGRCAQTIYGYTVDKNIGFATVRADVPDGAELTVGCNDSPAVVVNKVFC